MLALVCVLASCGENSDGSTTEAHTSYDAFAFYPLSSNTYTVTISPEGKYYEEIVIPSTYNGGTVVEIADEGFKECKNLRHIKLPETITQIGDYAFEGCGLFTISFTNSVESIGSHAFEYCSIGNVYFEGNIEDWLNIFLYGNETSNPLHKGANLNLNNKLLEEIKESDVTNPYALNKVTENLTGCTSIKSVFIPDTITYINANAFSGCSSLENIIIPDSVTAIYQDAFFGCKSLKTITIPQSVTRIFDDAFQYCSSLENIVFADNSLLTEIGENAFDGCSSLKNFTTPNGVTSIGEYAFYNCTALESITLPNGITVINNHTFQNCSSLKQIVLPHAITRIGQYAFSGCNNLESITISIFLLYINYNAFKDCSSLKSINYQGDKFMWNLTITKGSDWDKNTGNYTIHCTDGNITK